MIERLSATRAYFVLEGHPIHRYELLAEYKDNRKIVGDEANPEVAKRIAERKKYFEQSDRIIELLSRRFPINVVRHERFECDDTVFNLVKRSSKAIPWTIVSNDSDFTQLLNEFVNVSVFNPMKKEYVSAPDYDYVVWKALRGDASDNVPGLVTDGVAMKLVNDPDALVTFLEDPEKMKIFDRNYELIKFAEWTDDVAFEMTSSAPERDWDDVKEAFDGMGFKSITNEKSWLKFVGTFDPMFIG